MGSLSKIQRMFLLFLVSVPVCSKGSRCERDARFFTGCSLCFCLFFLLDNHRRLFTDLWFLQLTPLMELFVRCFLSLFPRGASVLLLCLEKALFVVFSCAGFSLPALIVILPAIPDLHTPLKPPRREKKMWCWYWGGIVVSSEPKDSKKSPTITCRVHKVSPKLRGWEKVLKLNWNGRQTSLISLSFWVFFLCQTHKGNDLTIHIQTGSPTIRVDEKLICWFQNPQLDWQKH